MPRIRQYADKYRREDFEKRCRVQMALLELSDREVAELTGMSHTTLWRRIRNPDELRMGELVMLVQVLQLGVEDVLGLAGMAKALTQLRREIRKEIEAQIPEAPPELRVIGGVNAE